MVGKLLPRPNYIYNKCGTKTNFIYFIRFGLYHQYKTSKLFLFPSHGYSTGLDILSTSGAPNKLVKFKFKMKNLGGILENVIHQGKHFFILIFHFYGYS